MHTTHRGVCTDTVYDEIKGKVDECGENERTSEARIRIKSIGGIRGLWERQLRNATLTALQIYCNATTVEVLGLLRIRDFKFSGVHSLVNSLLRPPRTEWLVVRFALSVSI